MKEKKMERESREAEGRRAKSSESERKTVACATDETKLWLRQSVKQCRNPCSRSPAVYQDLSTCHDWPVKKSHCRFANQVEGKFETHFR